MKLSILTIALLLLVFVSGSNVSAQSLSLDTSVLETKYCLEPEGFVTFRVSLRLTYKNTGVSPIVMSSYTPIRGFTLRTVDGPSPLHGLEDKNAPSPLFDASKLDPSRPDPQQFLVVLPGGKDYSLVQQVIIGHGANKDGVSVLGTDQFLTFEAITWPANRKQGEALRRTWSNSGYLWMDPIKSSPTKVHIEESPRFVHCAEPPVIRRIKTGRSQRHEEP